MIETDFLCRINRQRSVNVAARDEIQGGWCYAYDGCGDAIENDGSAYELPGPRHEAPLPTGLGRA